MKLPDALPRECPACGADTENGFRVKTTSYTVYLKRRGELRKVRSALRSVSTRHCLTCGADLEASQK